MTDPGPGEASGGQPPAAPGQPRRRVGSMSQDSTELEACYAAARRRALRSPEYQWRMLERQRRGLSLDPAPARNHGPLTAAVNAIFPGSTSTRPRSPNRSPSRERRDPLLNVFDEMNGRAALLARPSFRPSQYPGLTDPARQTADEGWLAWSILPDLRTVLQYARNEKPAKVGAIERAVGRTLELATAFVRGRQAALGEYERERVERPITEALAGTGNGGADYPGQDPSEPERITVEHHLGIESPWIAPPAPLSMPRQIIDQLRAKGRSSEKILTILHLDGWGDSPEAQELAREIGAARAATATNAAPVPAALDGTKSGEIADDSWTASLTPGALALWDHLAGRCGMAKDLANPAILNTSAQTIREQVAEIRRASCNPKAIDKRSGFGYFRPDQPPDWGTVKPKRQRRIGRP